LSLTQPHEQENLHHTYKGEPCTFSLQSSYFIRVIPKVRKTQHQNPEFIDTQGEIFKKLAKKSTLAFKGAGGVKLRKPSILVVN
jgi:hypothetical protein